MKRMIALALSAMMALSLVACGSNNTNHAKDSAEIPNPFTECKTMEEATQLVGFDVVVPDTIEGMDKSVIRVDAEGKLIEVIYSNEDEKIVIRKAEGSEDVSGDYTKYADTNIVTIGDAEVTMKGNEDKVNVAIWVNGNYTYSITSNSAMGKVAMTDLINATDNDEADIIGGDPATWGPALDSDDNTDVEIPDPFIECDTMSEAEKAAGFSMTIPDTIDGYTKQTIRAAVLSDNTSMIEVIYHNSDENEKDEIRIRKASGSEDISGDYTQYTDTNIATIGGLKVTIKGENGQINLATWTDNGYTYAISACSESGISSTAMTNLIVSMQ